MGSIYETTTGTSSSKKNTLEINSHDPRIKHVELACDEPSTGWGRTPDGCCVQGSKTVHPSRLISPLLCKGGKSYSATLILPIICSSYQTLTTSSGTLSACLAKLRCICHLSRFFFKVKNCILRCTFKNWFKICWIMLISDILVFAGVRFYVLAMYVV